MKKLISGIFLFAVLGAKAQDSTYLKWGGEIRYQYFHVTNPGWGDEVKDKDGYLLSRFLLHGDLSAGKNVRFFGELQGSMANGKLAGTSPVDENPLDLHQLYMDVNSNKRDLVFRVGRQEFSYGSQRLVSVRELPNNRQSFDAARAMYQSGFYHIEAFYGNYVSASKNIFDDRSNKGIHLWGAYLVRNNIPFVRNADIYYLGLEKRTTTFEDGTGRELRHSIGTRVWGVANGWKYDFEGVYQFGDFTGKQISAWTLSSNTTYRFSKARLQPEVGLKTEFISGDKQTGDNRLQTFNPLFPKGAYFGLAAFIGPSNLFDIHPSIALQLVKDKLVWTTDYDAFWRQSAADGIYAPNGSVIYSSNSSDHKFIGHQVATDLTFTPNKKFLARGECTWFKAGSYIKDVSAGKAILFIAVTTTYKF
jgi:hypothetical protein